MRKHLAHFATRVRPGGYLIVEEISLFTSKTAPPTPQTAVYRKAWGAFVDHMHNNGQQTELGNLPDQLLRDMGDVWESVEGRTLEVPFNPLSDGMCSVPGISGCGNSCSDRSQSQYPRQVVEDFADAGYYGGADSGTCRSGIDTTAAGRVRPGSR